MAGSDIRDHHRVRSGDLCQLVHVPEMTDAHFQHGDFMLLPKPEDGERKPQTIVEVALRLQCPVMRLKHRGNHFLGACLADRPGDPHDRCTQDFQILLRNLPERFLRVRNLDPESRNCPVRCDAKASCSAVQSCRQDLRRRCGCVPGFGRCCGRLFGSRNRHGWIPGFVRYSGCLSRSR